MALISGEAGIGKTSLLRRVRGCAEQDGARVVGRLRGAVHAPSPGAAAGHFPPDRRRFSLAICAAAGRHEIFKRSSTSLRACPCPRSWSSRMRTGRTHATLDLIKFLGRRLARARRDAGGELSRRRGERQASAALGHRRPAARLARPHPAAPLSEGAVEQLAAAAGRSSAGLHEVTGGNPFFVTEVLAASENKVPSTVRDAVIARLARLSSRPAGPRTWCPSCPGKAERWLIDGHDRRHAARCCRNA